jgi:hypothetical protein
MERFCTVRGCDRPVKGRAYGRRCNAHRHRARRHGHPEQLGITRKELKRFEGRIEGLVAKNPEARGWAALDQRWEALTKHAADIVEAAKGGKPHQRNERRAAEEVLKIAQGTEGRAVWVRVAALYAFQEEFPQRFLSDRAFLYELVRTVRRLSAVSVSQYYNAKTGRTKLVYRDPPPQAIEFMAAWLREVFGFAGLHLAREWREKRERSAREKARERDEINEAVKEAVTDA